MELLINADDFGLSSDVNKAIVRAFKMGIIDRTTAIANSPFFSESCQLARANGFENRIGVHFNITEGKPINPQMARTPLFCSNSGRFMYQRNTKNILSRSEMNAISAECEDQILRFREQGLHPIHLDSHKHVHTEWFIFRAIEPVLRRYGISSVRPANNIGSCSFPKRTYKKIFNAYLKKGNWISVGYFGDCSEIMEYNARSFTNNSVVEIMIHPTIGPSDVLTDALSGQEIIPLVQELRQWSHFHNHTG